MTTTNLISAGTYTTIPVEPADHRIPYGDDPSQFAGQLVIDTILGAFV